MSRPKAINPADDWVSLVGQILADVPVLDGAACVGRSDLFDPVPMAGRKPLESPAEVAYRHAAAAKICARCPALAACRDWTASTAANVAGYTPGTPQPKPVGRPRKDAA